MEPDTVIIGLDEYEDLCEKAVLLDALLECNVDSWEGFEQAQELAQQWLEDTEEPLH